MKRTVVIRNAMIVALACLGCMVSQAHAGKMISHRADATLRTDGRIQLAGNWTIRAGENNAPNAGCVVLPFALPDIAVNGMPFKTAILRLQLASITGNVKGFNLDLYGLKRIADKPEILEQDYYAGVKDEKALLIQDNFLTAHMPLRSKQNPYISTTPQGEEALQTFLCEAWSEGKNAGKYIFLRLSPDLFPMPKGNNAYDIVAANASQDREKPTITYAGEGDTGDASVLTIPQSSNGVLLVDASQIQSKGTAEVSNSEQGGVNLVIADPQQGSGLQIVPYAHMDYWDLSTWEMLSVDVENKSSSVQMRLLMQIAGMKAGKVTYSSVGIALNPQEKRTLRMRLPHEWAYATPKGPRGPHVLDTSRVSKIDFFVQWPFENTKADLVNCRLSNVRVQGYVTPGPSLTAETFFPFIDEYGQNVHEQWDTKIHSPQDLKDQYTKENAELSQSTRPTSWNRYGSWQNGPKLKATGNFRTEKYEGKWYFVDPDGSLFWSHGVDVLSKYNDGMKVIERENWYVSVKPDEKTFFPTDLCLSIKYGQSDYRPRYFANLQKRLVHWGFNSIGNWSQSELIEQGKTPYTLQLTDYNWRAPRIKDSKLKFYDVWDPRYVSLMSTLIADQGEKNPVVLKSLTDPMCIGYFIDNELNFGNRGKQTLTDDILKCPATQAAKQAFISDLKTQYQTIDKLNVSWETTYTRWESMLEAVDVPSSDGYHADADIFFVRCVDRYFQLARDAIKTVAPHRLYLGCRFISTDAVRPVLYEASQKYCDVLTVNIYAHSAANFPVEKLPDMPVLIGEFHFGTSGANGRGMFSAGLCQTGITQDERALAYTRFIQGALVHPNFVGAHWFQYRDQPITGRGDGEAYQIGFVDVADTPYTEMCKAARLVGENMYRYRLKGELANAMTKP